MIYVGLGANLPSPVHGGPVDTLNACLKRLNTHGLKVLNCSHWYESAPVPISDQPWYVNGVAAIESQLEARDVLKTLLDVENEFGRVRSEANAPRVLDLDLIAYHDQIIEDAGKIEDKPFCVPHPRMHERAFVLLPLNDLDPHWTHPKRDQNISDLIAQLPEDQIIRTLKQE